MKRAACGTELTAARGAVWTHTHGHAHLHTRTHTHAEKKRGRMYTLPAEQTTDEILAEDGFPAGVLALVNRSWLRLLCLLFRVIDSRVNISECRALSTFTANYMHWSFKQCIFWGAGGGNQPISKSPLMPYKTVTPYVLQVDWNQLWLIHSWVFLKPQNKYKWT